MKIRFSGVCERDMDLFLVEELVADPELLATLFARCGLGEPDYHQTSVTHSAVAGNGESDVEVRSILKTEATAFQAQQAQRSGTGGEPPPQRLDPARCHSPVRPVPLHRRGIENGFHHTLCYEELREHKVKIHCDSANRQFGTKIESKSPLRGSSNLRSRRQNGNTHNRKSSHFGNSNTGNGWSNASVLG